MNRHRSVKRIFSFSSGTLNRLGIWGAVTGQLAIVPPACSIFTRAEADTVTPFTVNFRPTSPMPSSLIGRSGRRTSPAPNSCVVVPSTPSASLPKWRTFTTWAGCLKGFVKPRFGMRRMRGICPPSNPGRVWPPVRAVCPLPPRPAVLPIPEPGPRPLRMRARCEPAGARRPCSTRRSTVTGLALAFAFRRIGAFALGRARPVVFGFRFVGAMPLLAFLHRRHLNEVAHLIEHPAERGVILLHHGVLMMLESERFERPPRAHRASRDHPGARRGGLQQHPARAVVPDDLVRDGAAGERDLHHPPACGLDRLAHRLAYLVSLPGRDADPSLPIADGHERVEPEAPAALDDFGDAVDRDHVLDETIPF